MELKLSKNWRGLPVAKAVFLTIDAYHDNEYSAIPFYEKQGFFALQEFIEDYDSLCMAYKV